MMKLALPKKTEKMRSNPRKKIVIWSTKSQNGHFVKTGIFVHKNFLDGCLCLLNLEPADLGRAKMTILVGREKTRKYAYFFTYFFGSAQK